MPQRDKPIPDEWKYYPDVEESSRYELEDSDLFSPSIRNGKSNLICICEDDEDDYTLFFGSDMEFQNTGNNPLDLLIQFINKNYTLFSAGNEYIYKQQPIYTNLQKLVDKARKEKKISKAAIEEKHGIPYAEEICDKWNVESKIPEKKEEDMITEQKPDEWSYHPMDDNENYTDKYVLKSSSETSMINYNFEISIERNDEDRWDLWFCGKVRTCGVPTPPDALRIFFLSYMTLSERKLFSYPYIEEANMYKNLKKLFEEKKEIRTQERKQNSKKINEEKKKISHVETIIKSETETTTVTKKKGSKMDFFKMMMLGQMMNQSNPNNQNNMFNMFGNGVQTNPMMFMMMMDSFDGNDEDDKMFGGMTFEDFMMKGFDFQEMFVRKYAEKKRVNINEEAVSLHKMGKLPNLPLNDIQAICRVYISNFTVPQLLKIYGEEMNTKEMVEDLGASTPKEKQKK